MKNVLIVINIEKLLRITNGVRLFLNLVSECIDKEKQKKIIIIIIIINLIPYKTL